MDDQQQQNNNERQNVEAQNNVVNVDELYTQDASEKQQPRRNVEIEMV